METPLLKFQWRAGEITTSWPYSTDSDSVGLGWGLRICISHELPGDAHADGLLTPFYLPSEFFSLGSLGCFLPSLTGFAKPISVGGSSNSLGSLTSNRL